MRPDCTPGEILICGRYMFINVAEGNVPCGFERWVNKWNIEKIAKVWPTNEESMFIPYTN